MITLLNEDLTAGLAGSPATDSAYLDPPGLTRVGDEYAPTSPTDLRGTGLDPTVVLNLALKTAHSALHFTTEWAARRLHLPHAVVSEALKRLQTDNLLDVLGASGPFGFRYAISERGRERASRLMEISGYVGPAPVSLDNYTATLQRLVARCPAVQPEHVAESLSKLVLREDEALTAGLAASSGKSLFLHGPSGNGKSSLGRFVHGALRGTLWIPYCIGIEESIIRVYDPHVHQAVDTIDQPSANIDRRWVQIRRPLVVAGGEMTLDSLELIYSPAQRYYEAPLQMKANGGTFLVDDYGRQRVDPRELLNRLIIPLEHQIDYLTLHTGQKIEIPFVLMLIIATNLKADAVTDPAFLRRMGYRLHMDRPSPERYRHIFDRYAELMGLPVPDGLVDRIMARYENEQRELRGCEPRDLIDRARDICRFTNRSQSLDDSVLDLAWTSYFGNTPRT